MKRKTLLGIQREMCWLLLLVIAIGLVVPTPLHHTARLVELYHAHVPADSKEAKPYYRIILMVPSVAAWRDRRNFASLSHIHLTSNIQNRNLLSFSFAVFAQQDVNTYFVGALPGVCASSFTSVSLAPINLV